jgi:hypothetical protein
MTRNDDGIWFVAGSCNGLICFISMHISRLCLCNHSTRRKSEFFLPSSYSFHFQYSFGNDKFNNNDVYLSVGTINWLAVRGYFGSDYLNFDEITIEQYVILSLDLSTETHIQLLLPQGFDKVPRNPPKLVVLTDLLCFCHDYEETHFIIIWQMKDFGVQKSWILLYKISYDNFFPAMEHKR